MFSGNGVQSIHRIKLDLTYESDLGETTTKNYEIYFVFAPNIPNAQGAAQKVQNITETSKEEKPENILY